MLRKAPHTVSATMEHLPAADEACLVRRQQAGVNATTTMTRYQSVFEQLHGLGGGTPWWIAPGFRAAIDESSGSLLCADMQGWAGRRLWI